MSGDVRVVVKMPVEDYLNLDSGSRRVIDALAVEFGGAWIGSGTDMTTGMSSIEYRMPAANVAGFAAALKSVGLGGKAVR